MHSLLDANGYRLTNSIIWADNRSIIQTEQLKQMVVCPLPANGNSIHPMSPLTKLMWMRDYDFDRRQILCQEYIFLPIVWGYVVDYSIALQAYST